MWAPEAEGTITNWNQIDPSFPDQALTLYGAGTDSGTFDYFTDEINGEEGASRTDYNPTEDDNVTVTGVNGDMGALGYFGFSLPGRERRQREGRRHRRRRRLRRAVGRDACRPASYVPLARPLFIYVAAESAARPEVQAFVAVLRRATRTRSSPRRCTCRSMTLRRPEQADELAVRPRQLIAAVCQSSTTDVVTIPLTRMGRP